MLSNLNTRVAHSSTRPQSVREEIVNSIVHGAALLASLVAIPFLFQLTETVPVRAVNIAGSVVFAATLVLLYLCSTLYHALPEGRARLIMLRLDHGAIYLFIAGSFTPFAMASLDGGSEWLWLALVWLLAASTWFRGVRSTEIHHDVSVNDADQAP